jgi:serine/threonine protein kinase
MIKSMPPHSEWWVKVSDFGITKRMNSAMEVLSTVKGTMPYMAPELLSHEPGRMIMIDHQAADMWSLGEMVFRMLTKTPAFGPGTLYHYLARPDLFPSYKLIEKGVSHQAVDFIQSLMKPPPESRLRSVAALYHPWLQICRPSEMPFSPSKFSHST